MICWYCQKETDIKDTDYGDHRCKHCNILISIMNPTVEKIDKPLTTADDWMMKVHQLPMSEQKEML